MSRPLSIACLLPDFDGGGAQRSIINLANAFKSDGHAARLIVGRGDGPAADWVDPGLVLRDLGVARTRAMLPRLIRELREGKPDILFATMIDANIMASLAIPWLGTRPILVLRETNSQRARGDIGFVRRHLIRWAYRRADRIVALSEGVRSELIEDLRLDPTHASTIHNPVDLSPTLAPERPSQMPAGICIVGAGRLVRQKNFPLLIETLARLPETVSLAILGDGPDREDLAGLVESLSLSNRVVMPGFVTNPRSWFTHATAFVLSSRWEGFGHVLVEAMAAGAPVIATDCPHGPRDIIKNGQTGLLVRSEDGDALADAVSRLLNDEPLRASLAAKGRESTARFSTSRISKQYMRLFTDAMGDK